MANVAARPEECSAAGRADGLLSRSGRGLARRQRRRHGAPSRLSGGCPAGRGPASIGVPRPSGPGPVVGRGVERRHCLDAVRRATVRVATRAPRGGPIVGRPTSKRTGCASCFSRRVGRAVGLRILACREPAPPRAGTVAPAPRLHKAGRPTRSATPAHAAAVLRKGFSYPCPVIPLPCPSLSIGDGFVNAYWQTGLCGAFQMPACSGRAARCRQQQSYPLSTYATTKGAGMRT